MNQKEDFLVDCVITAGELDPNWYGHFLDNDLLHHEVAKHNVPYSQFNEWMTSPERWKRVRELEQIVSCTDTDFHPVGVVEEAVGAVGEVEVHADVREHHDDGLVEFHHVDVAGHIDFIEFRSVEESDLFLDFDGG